MQLRSGCRFILSRDILDEIAATKHDLCEPDFLLELSRSSRIVTVGDVTTENALKAGVDVFLQIVDLKTKREEKERFSHHNDAHIITNEAGTLSHDLFFLIESLLKGKGGRIEVEGEEDLTVIPIIYYSDVNTVVAYGVPDVGMAYFKVNSDSKAHVKNLIERMNVECLN